MSAGSSLSCSSSSVSASFHNQQLLVNGDDLDLPRAATITTNSSSGYNTTTLPENQWRKNALGKAVEKSNNHGKWSKEETDELKQSIEQYCASKGIHAANLYTSADGKTPDGVRGAWGEIAKSLPHRTVQSVYRKGMRTIHPFQRGEWTSDEQRLLVELVQRHGKRWATIQHLLNRSVDSCRDKYREMSKEYIRGRWDSVALQQLIRTVREVLRIPSSKWLPPPPHSNNCGGQKQPPTTTTTTEEQLNNTNEEASEGDCASNRSNDEMAGFPNESQTRYFLSSVKSINQYCEKKQVNIPWGVVSSRLENRSRLSCFRKWRKMTLRDMSDDNPADEDECDDEHLLDNPEQPVQNTGAENGNIQEICETTSSVKPLKKKRKHKKNSDSAKVSFDKKDRCDDDENRPDVQYQLAEDNVNMKENCERSAAAKASKKKPKNKKSSDSSASANEKVRKGKKSTSANVTADPPVPLAHTEPITASVEPIVSNNGSILMLHNQEDVQLLKQLAATNASRPTDIDWAAGLSHPTAYARYLQIIGDVERINDNDDVLDMPIAAQAKALLQRAIHKNN